MKSESVGTIVARIADMEGQEKRLALMIRFPPPGCRSVTVWRQVHSERLESLRQSLSEQRELLRWKTSQSMLPME